MTRRIRHILPVLVLCATQAAASLPRDPAEQARIFAACMGRYTAAMEHAWLLGNADGATPQARRELFEMMLDAILPDAREAGFEGIDAWRYRSGAKQAQSRLLQLSSFDPDRDRARRAQTLARRQIAICESLILG